MFAFMAIYGMVTDRDLSSVGNICLMGLVGIIIASCVNLLFLRSGMFDFIVSIVGVLIFVGLTAYDANKAKRIAATSDSNNALAMSMYCALELYLDFINLFLESGKPIIVFCSLHDIVDEIHKAFPGSATITGRDSMMDKQRAVDNFQSGKVKLIICSIKAAGVGLTLTASSNVAFVELPWTYADCCQCEDRAHRIGQKDNVTCYYILGRNTIDGKLYNIIHTKKSIANEIMATSDDIPQDIAYFNELVEAFTNQKQTYETENQHLRNLTG